MTSRPVLFKRTFLSVGDILHLHCLLRGARAHVVTEHQNVVSVMAELNLKLHLILTINFNRHTWLMATILDSTGLEANVPQSLNWLEETNISPFSFSQETLPGLESVGLESHESPLGSNG